MYLFGTTVRGSVLWTFLEREGLWPLLPIVANAAWTSRTVTILTISPMEDAIYRERMQNWTFPKRSAIPRKLLGLFAVNLLTIAT